MLKKLLVILLAAVSLLAVVLLIILVPGNMQIREVKITLPSMEQINQAFAQQNSEAFPSNIQYINTAQQEGPFATDGSISTLGHVGVLISWPDGKQFLIDSGMKPEEAKKFGANLELIGGKPTQTFGAIEAQLGAYIDNIEGIAFTHLHSDHSAGISDICIALRSRNETATIFQTQAQATLHNMLTEPGQELINHSDCQKAILDNNLIKAIPNFEGLFAIEAGGHTPGSTVFVTQLKGKTWIFAGDLTNAMVDIHNNKGKGWLYSHVLVPEDTQLLEQWRVWLNKVDKLANVSVLVAHDIKAFEASELSAWQEE